MIGIYGGTFDPVHLGHIGLAHAAMQRLPLQHIYFVPLGEAVHRGQPQASTLYRCAMLQAAMLELPGCSMDSCELDRAGPSWSIQTLADFRQRFPGETLCWLMGSDAFRGIDSWLNWQSLLEMAYLVVVTRQGDTAPLPPVVADYLQENRIDVDALGESPETPQKRHGILWIEADVPDISSSQIRQSIRQGRQLDDLVPQTVARLIREENLYGG